MTTVVEAGPSLMVLDPAGLIAHPANVRADLRLDADFVASVAEHGVLEPLVVTPLPEGGFRLLAGHRRAAAAVEAALDSVQCVVRPDLIGDVEALETMLVENEQRADLTLRERVAAYSQLLAFDGYTPERAAKRLGRKVEEIRQVALVAAMPPAEVGLVDELDLVTAANLAEALEEFAGDNKALAELRKAAAGNPSLLQYTLAHLRARRRISDDKAALKARLTEEGVQVTAKPKNWGWNSRAASVDRLKDAEGQPVDNHSACPGHRAFIDVCGSDVQAVPYCDDPEGNGHQRGKTSYYRSPEEVAAEETRQEAAQERRLARLASAEVRSEFVEQLAARKAPKGYLAAIARLLHHLEAEGASAGSVEREQPNTDAQAVKALACLTYDMAERAVTNSWQADKCIVEYLDHLAAYGYGLTEPETEWHAEVLAQRERRAAVAAMEALEDDDEDLNEDPADDEA